MRLMGLFLVMVFTYVSLISADELWDKAVEIFEKSKSYEAKTMYMVMEELKKDGSVTEKNEIYLDVITNSDGKKDSKVVKIIKNGKDVTEDIMKKKDALNGKKDEKKESFSMQMDMLARDKQHSVVSKRLDQTLEIDGISSVGYSFAYALNAKENYVGTLWLHPETGVPLRSEFTVSPLPSKVKKMTIAAVYTSINDMTVLKKMDVTVHVSFLIISKRLRSMIEFGY